MISKEQLAHNLTMIYLNNRYGVNVEGSITSGLDGQVDGIISTEKLPEVSEIKYKKVGTGERGFLRIEKKVKVEDGYKSDGIIDTLIAEYYATYSKVLSRLEQNEQSAT